MQTLLVKTFSVIFLLSMIVTSNAQVDHRISQQDNFLKNGVIAHRGAWKNLSLPQNSIASLQNAINIEAAGSEFDVHLTADGIVVVTHDHVFEGMDIEKSNYSDLAKNLLKNGEQLPKLEDFLRIGTSQEKTRLILELKPSAIGKERSLLLAQKVAEKVAHLKANKWIIYISFDYDILKKLLELDPLAKTMFLGGNAKVSQLKTDRLFGAAYHHSVYKKDEQWISNAHAEGIQVNAWTVNDGLIMDYLLSRDIDFITTDEPELLLSKISGDTGKNKWQLVWADEFNYEGLPDTLKWNYDTRGNSYGWGNNEAQWYNVANPENTFVNNGNLKITAKNEPCSGKQYSSGRITTKGKGDWKYCKVEVRAKLPVGKGTWPAIWMLSSAGTYGSWPKSGEIDIMEHVGYDPDLIHSTVHTEKYNHVKGTQVGKAVELKTSSTQFHIYTTEWDENEIRSYLDGKLYFSFQKENSGFGAWPFDQDFHLILNLAIGGGWGGRQGIDNSIFPHTFEIDYVRVFQEK